MSITIAKSVNFGAGYTGFTNVGYTLVNFDKSIQEARSIAGIVEVITGTGIFGGNITFPDNWSGFIVWDTGDTPPAVPATASENFDSRLYQISSSAPSVGITNSTSIAKSVNFGGVKTGLSTVGYTLQNSDKSIAQGRTTSGITEISAGTGIYGGDISFSANFSGFILWDTGDSSPYYAIENFDTRSYEASNAPQTSTFTYTYFPGTSIGMVRNLCGDVGPQFALADDEINAFFQLTNTDLFMTAAVACRRIAASQVSISIIRKAGNFSQDMTSIFTNLMDLANAWEEMAENVPCDAQAEVIYTDFNYNQLLTDKVHRGEPFDTF